MADAIDIMIDQVDDLLNRAACEVVLGAADGAASVRTLLGTAAAALEAAGLGQLAGLVAEASESVVDALPAALARIEANWNGWKATRVAGAGAEPDRATAPGMPEPAAAPEAVVDDELLMLQADPELAGMFIAEALDHLSSIEALVLQVEAQPGDSKLLNDVFRPFHTIKGNAGALGVTSVQEVAHRVENLLDLDCVLGAEGALSGRMF